MDEEDAAERPVSKEQDRTSVRHHSNPQRDNIATLPKGWLSDDRWGSRASDGSQEVVDDDVDGNHEWHFRYNRRLQCFSQAVASLTFSKDGNYLLSSTSSSDVKVWDAGTWSEKARLRGCHRSEPRALVISPASHWLVCAYPQALQVFHCTPPFRLEKSLPAPPDPATKEPHEWQCVAFSPMAEVDHPEGRVGQDNHLAAFSSAALCTIDYSSGWTNSAPSRMRSLMQCSRPNSLEYTSCGTWLICGFASGQIQIWNAFSLTMVRTLDAHPEAVTCVASSPRAAAYEARFVSCGADTSIRLWNTVGWLLEQTCIDTKAGDAGVRQVSFSASGNWLVSVAAELTVWRVCLSNLGDLNLQIHQRLAAVCNVEGPKSAAFCKFGDALAVGSRDGVLGIWVKHPGRPPDPSLEGRASQVGEESGETVTSPGGTSRVRQWSPSTAALPRPMNRVVPQRPEPPSGATPGHNPGAEIHPVLAARAMRRLGPVSAASPLAVRASQKLVRMQSGHLALRQPTVSNNEASRPSSPQDPARLASIMRSKTFSASEPDLGHWKSRTNNELKDFVRLSNMPKKTIGSSSSLSSSLSAPGGSTTIRRAMLHGLNRDLVSRISLDPKIITDT